jgi:hypothetical protein
VTDSFYSSWDLHYCIELAEDAGQTAYSLRDFPIASSQAREFYNPPGIADVEGSGKKSTGEEG